MVSKLWEISYPESLKNYQIDEEKLQGSLAEFAKVGAEKYSNDPAFSFVLPNGFSQSLSYSQIDRLSDAFANYLKNELKLDQGSVVAVQMPNALHYPIAAFGIWKAGLILTNINPLYTASELDSQLKDSNAKILIVCDLFVKNAQQVAKNHQLDLIVTSLNDFFSFPVSTLIKLKLKKEVVVPEVPYIRFAEALKIGQKNINVFVPSIHPIALYQYTGGTTGKSKGAVLSHYNLKAVIQMAKDMLEGFYVNIDVKDTIVTALPMYHIFAFNFNFLLFFSCGGHNVLIPNPRPLANMEKAFKKFEVKWITGVDTLYAGLLQQDWFIRHPPKIKLAISGGTTLRPSTARLWKEKVSEIIEGYGLTESSCFVSFNPPTGHQQLGSVGLPLPSIDVKLIKEDGTASALNEPGELWIKGLNVIEQYLNNEAETKNAIADGWFKTGDIATLNAEGFLTIVDRKKDMILVSGFNVYPNEIEDVLAKHPDVVESAVIGILDQSTGEAIKAFVVAKHDKVKADDLIAFCQQSLTNYKIPKHIEFCEELPKSPIGKVLRAKLKATVKS
ncbi:AMP-binding protein [Acinetobacter puyangensis]|uniref:AMP-binding protein n=1 Tax=Acinetobacter puyangensis TaxID=1096779 RepID=UPI003A4DAB2E